MSSGNKIASNMVKTDGRLPTQDDAVKLKRTRRSQGLAEGSDAGAETSTTVTTMAGAPDANSAAGPSFLPPAGQRRQPQTYENTYRLEPVRKFQTAQVEALAETILIERLKEEKYEPSRCKRLSQELAAVIMERIKALQLRRYKLVAVVSIGSVKERPGMQFGSRCLWNHDTDTFASVKFTNGSLFAVAMVYGLYYE